MPISTSRQGRNDATLTPSVTSMHNSPLTRENVYQLEQARRRAEEQLDAMRELQQVAQSLSAELNPERLLRKVLSSALQLMDASAGALLLHEPLTDELKFQVVEGSLKGLEGKRVKSGEGIAGWVFTHGEPRIVDDLREDPRLYHAFHRAAAPRTHSLVAVPLIIMGKKIGALFVLDRSSGDAFGAGDLDVLNALAIQSAVAIENARLYRSLWDERNRILAVEEEVRKELAREVHDGPAQLLSALVMNVRFVQTLLGEGELDLARSELVSLEELSERTLKMVRELLFNQRPVILETQGLFPALEMYVNRLNETREVTASLEVMCEPVRLAGRADRTIFSIVQEAVGNARKHAPGAAVRIRLERDGEQLCVRVIDTGPGFDVSRVQSTYDRRGSLGLLNMNERAQQIGATLRIESAAGRGTTVMLSVPVTSEARP